MEKEIMVSIICNAYNHEKYIKDALDSFLMQKTNFAFEILIHDDASTDNTALIIKEYEKKYPDIIKAIYQIENQYSQHRGITLNYQIPRAKGKYLAWCEGDDYWIDENKLQKQYDILENNCNVDICTHSANLVNSETKEVIKIISPKKKTQIIKVEDVIMWKLWPVYVATNSVFIRKNVFNLNYTFFKQQFNDQTMEILGSLKGGMYYLNDCMSSYRYLSIGSFTSKMLKDNEIKITNSNRWLNTLNILNNETNYLYMSTIYTVQIAIISSKLSLEIEELFYLRKEYKFLCKEMIKNKEYYTFKARLMLWLKFKFSFLYKIYKEIKYRTNKNERK